MGMGAGVGGVCFMRVYTQSNVSTSSLVVPICMHGHSCVCRCECMCMCAYVRMCVCTGPACTCACVGDVYMCLVMWVCGVGVGV